MTAARSAPCADVLARLSAYLDGEADEATCAAIEAHCRTCDACAGAIDGLRRTTGLCHEAGARPLPEAVKDRARAAIARLLASPPPE